MTLVRLCAEISPEFTALALPSAKLSNYGVNVRYPSPIELDMSDVELALELADTLQAFVRTALASTETR